MERKITIQAGGQQYPLNLGINRFYKYFMEATGIDLLAQGLVSVESVRVFDYVAGFLYAGHRAECVLNKQPCNLTFDQAREIVLDMTEKEASDILVQVTVCYMGGKEEKNAEPQAESL